MTTTKVVGHTPGPWTPHRYPQIGGGYGWTIQAGASRGISVANLAPGLTSDRIEPICEANARLIAAAPEMLQSLKEAIDLDHSGGFDDIATWAEWKDAALAAIAKATGE